VRIDHLQLEDFRNYGHKELDPHGAITILVGPNAAGKTNLVEAIQTVTTTESFRRPRWDELVRWGRPGAEVRLAASGASSAAELRLTVDASGKREFFVNGSRKRRTSDVTGIVPCIVFTPDDLLMVKGSADRRRSALDAAAGQIWPTFRSARREYAKVLRQRNALMKEEGAGEQAAAWDERLVELGSKVTAYRCRLLASLEPELSDAHERLAGGQSLELEYADRTGLDPGAWREAPGATAVEEAFRAELSRRRPDEAARRVSLVGPHRDDVVFLIEGRDARAFGSQGQQRTVALAWKMSEIAVVRGTTGRSPVLLLDDVMSELDEARRRSLLDTVVSDIQTIITTTNIGYFDEPTLAAAEVVRL
jgi:DNA replication and repair protein RecF